MEDNIFQTSASFISAEMQEILNHQIVVMANWKWLALAAATLFVLFMNKFVRVLLYKIKKSINLPEERTFFSYFLQQNIERGLSWILAALMGMALVENLELPPNLEKYLLVILKVTLGLHVVRLAYFAADASGLLIDHLAKKRQTQIGDQLAPLATKMLKTLVIIIGSLVILQNFGVNVSAILAGLGLGGVALAFAAQDTVANFFGTVTILLDSPFRVGDHVKIQDVEGVVEEVGFRSTRIRSLTNTLVTLPNSTVAKEKVDNITERRGVCRFRHILGFTYSATPEQIDQFSEQLRYHLKQDPRVQQDRVAVQFHELADSSQNILVNFHFVVQPDESEALILQKYLLDIVKLSQASKLDFAFPTRTLIMESAKLSL
ncbi:mechanosensitive ion channel family protein [Pseudobdellovibrio sp. HCB154]|uniref:mechanosensitive ion channel family protein n=1 Tax=Pseudobdellovibrio sp. HCB154 TaxID=3386277 RepID=UPI003916EFA6